MHDWTLLRYIENVRHDIQQQKNSTIYTTTWTYVPAWPVEEVRRPSFLERWRPVRRVQLLLKRRAHHLTRRETIDHDTIVNPSGPHRWTAVRGLSYNSIRTQKKTPNAIAQTSRKLSYTLATAVRPGCISHCCVRRLVLITT